MTPNNNPEEFYKKLKVQLSDTSLWPAPYLYKFIVPTDLSKIKAIEDIFDHTGAVITRKESIAKYKEVGMVEGVISL